MTAEVSVPIHPAVTDDVPALARLETAVMGADAWGEQALADELAGVPATRTVLVVEEAGGPVAYGVLRAVGQTAEVQRIVVHPSRQRHGLGGAVLRALTVNAQRRGCSELLLEVAADNAPARALYAAHGLVEIARRRGYYSAGRDALVLRRPLERRRPYGEPRA